MADKSSKSIVVVLDNIRSSHNVGSIFRTCDAVGVDEIILTGTTPAPVDRFGRKNRALLKVSLGADEFVLWRYAKSATADMARLKKDGYSIVAVEQNKDSVVYTSIRGQKIALIFGNEVDGISASVLKKADVVAEIPMRGRKESLNVAVAAGVVLFALNTCIR